METNINDHNNDNNDDYASKHYNNSYEDDCYDNKTGKDYDNQDDSMIYQNCSGIALAGNFWLWAVFFSLIIGKYHRNDNQKKSLPDFY